VKFAVVGTDHLHVVELASGLHDAGAELVAVMPTEDRIGSWLAGQYQGARTVTALDDALDGVDVVVTAAVPAERAAIGERAMRAGKNVLADKPGATTPEQLAQLRAAHADTGCEYLVLFSERLTNAAMERAEAIVASGRIGRVVHTVGLGPHMLNLDRRPAWFFDPDRYGGILVDIGSHQIDQFLAFTGTTAAGRVEVLAATVRAHAEHSGVEVLGEVLLGSDDASGYARVDYFTPAGLAPAWGDVRLTVVGTEGFLEVRHIDQTVFVVDGEGRELIDCAGQRSHWGRRYLDGALVGQDHVFTVCDLALAAQHRARRIG
jgi:predicted dehydrogenase